MPLYKLIPCSYHDYLVNLYQIKLIDGMINTHITDMRQNEERAGTKSIFDVFPRGAAPGLPGPGG